MAIATAYSRESHNDTPPFLTLVMENRSYGTGTEALRRTYPEGSALDAGDYTGGVLDPAPDLAKLAESVGAYGETVRTAEDVGPALQRGLAQVRQGVSAVIAAWLPTHVEEMGCRSSLLQGLTTASGLQVRVLPR